MKWLHILMLMDDTILLATSKERLIEKLHILHEYCTSHGMSVNNSKTKFMVINGDPEDREPIHLLDWIIEHCSKYVYLGAVFTADGSTASSLKAHLVSMKKHLNKLCIFMNTNKDIPFIAKRKVVEAAFNAAILYSCESWLDTSFQMMNSMYMTAIKLLLGVRTSTPNNLCLAELGMPPLSALIKHKQAMCIRKLIQTRRDIANDPFMFAFELTRTGNHRMYNHINSILEGDTSLETALSNLRANIQASDKTKCVTYSRINPTYTIHEVYSNTGNIPEYIRLAFTRLRLSSHRLRIETGRWSRLAREQRLCECGLVQDECHVMCDCPRTQVLRTSYDKPVIFPKVLIEAKDINDFKFIYDVLKTYET